MTERKAKALIGYNVRVEEIYGERSQTHYIGDRREVYEQSFDESFELSELVLYLNHKYRAETIIERVKRFTRTL